MRKEVGWAIVAGIIFGLIVAFGAWRINTKIGSQKQTEPSPIPKGEVVKEFKITLNKPENEDVVTESELIIEGLTKPLSSIIVSGESEDYITQANDNGIFQKEITLTPGVNSIRITAFDKEGKQSAEKVLVVYSSSFEKRDGLLETKEATDSGSSIREKVQAKVEELLNKPKAYLGTVTDIDKSNIQIKTKEGEIRQITVVEDEISVTKNDGKTNKLVNFTDVAIGDFIVAMGYLSGNKVLSTQRILITPETEDPQIEVVATTFDLLPTELKPTTKTLIFSYQNEINGEDKTTKIKLTDLEESSEIIYISQIVNSKPSLRTIFTTNAN